MCVHPVGRCVSTVLLITVSFCSLLVEDGGAATGRFGWMRWCLSSSVAVVGFLKFSLIVREQHWCLEPDQFYEAMRMGEENSDC